MGRWGVCREHTGAGAGAGAGDAGLTALEREAVVVQQVWDWWFLTFDLPLPYCNTRHTDYRSRPKVGTCTMMKLKDHL